MKMSENVQKCFIFFGRFWAEVVHAHLWSFTLIYGRSRAVHAGSRWFTLPHFRSLKSTIWVRCLYVTTVNHREPPWTAVNRREPWTSIIHREPPWTAVNHREPPWTTVKHREPAYHNMAYTCTQNIFLSLCWSDLCILWYPRGRQALWIIKTAFVKHGFMMLYRHWSS